MLVNLNLPPEERVKINNLILAMIIPGPHQPKDIDSLLVPLIEEMKVLNGILIIFLAM
jgi:hypothetical protein